MVVHRDCGWYGSGSDRSGVSFVGKHSKQEFIVTLQEKEQFIRDLTSGVTESLLLSVKRMPEDWDGHELRRLIAARFQRETTDMPRKRVRDFENEVLVRNL